MLILIILSFFYIPNTLNKKFDYDEFQHAHIAWTLKEGNVLYKDTFDHHGPIYAYILSFLWKCLSPKDEAFTLIIFRIISLIMLLVLLTIVYLITNKVFGTTTALLTVLIVICNNAVFSKGVEIRPDILQSTLLFCGVYFLILILKNNKRWYNYFLTGFFWSLTIISNFKTAIIICGFLLSFTIIYRKSLSLINIVQILSGFTAAIIPIFIILLISGNLKSCIYYNYLYNFQAYFVVNRASIRYSGVKNGLIYIILWFGLFVAGSFFLIKNNPDMRLSIFLIIISTYLILLENLNFYSQWKLSLVPLASIISGYGFYSIIKIKNSFINFIVAPMIIIIISTNLFLYPGYKKTWDFFAREYNNKEQIEFTDYVCKTIPKEEPIFTIWTNFGGYVFRPHLLYYWFINENQDRIMRKITGYDILGTNLINELIAKKCKYIIIDQEMNFLKYNYSQSYEFILKNYTCNPEYPYLRTKN